MTHNILRHWRKFHRDQLDQALAGPHGAVVKSIVDILDDLTPEKMPALLELMRAQDWRLVHADTRYTVLHEINAAISNFREREGRPPFDDALNDEQLTLFQIVFELVTVSCTSAGKRRRTPPA